MVVSGNKPSYASACRDLQDVSILCCAMLLWVLVLKVNTDSKQYPIACLCWGLKPASVRILSRTMTRYLTILATANSTAYATDTFTSTSITTSTDSITSTIVSTNVQSDSVTSTSTTQILYPTFMNGLRESRYSQKMRLETAKMIPRRLGNSDSFLSLTFNAPDTQPYLTGDPSVVLQAHRIQPDYSVLVFSNKTKYTESERNSPIFCRVEVDLFKCRIVEYAIWTYFTMCVDLFSWYLSVKGRTVGGSHNVTVGVV